MGNLVKVVTGIMLVLVLSACSLPRGAALQREVLAGSDDASADFAVYPVTRALLPTVQQWPLVGEEHLSWISASHGSNSQQIRPGDTVSVVIWDSNENSLLTPTGTRQVTLDALRVSPGGSIFVPYVGDVRISGMTPERARGRLQNAVEPIAPSAQVQLSLTEGRGNSVDLVGGVASPGSYPMPDRNYTVLSLIAAGGGVSASLANPQIRLKRGSRLFGTSIDRLYDEPGLDTLLRGGDQIIVEEDERYFLSVGAAGSESLHPFTKDIVTAMDAVSIVGGVLDTRGNPQGVLILREYPRNALSAGTRGPRNQQVVFTIDLTSADGLFAARNFRISPKDVVYVTESPVVSAQTVFSLIGSAFGLATIATN
ncbi:polysaccharide biosynthesis protein [Jannaschia pagri]|uniref:Polysaccharide biosynthesis protein n=1 Tax=Jannaschia pagri TaxID=2829797 RepID=A0ABQ4NPX8_9RHOB|nr:MULTISPECIES: polysaccharide biosynthesis/export family protein [unclassified Jannaschia]GIT92695.1 polysaccharide biosynthesis protein [Jannaschia sp. AI_61]GIT96445.1 polysaccharide biosynthesis protein [Jannaschia sp. AI_62]